MKTYFERAEIIANYRIVQDMLEKCEQNKTKAAIELGIDRRTIYNIINRYNQLQEKKAA